MNDNMMNQKIILLLCTLILCAPIATAQESPEAEVLALITSRDTEIKRAVRGMEDDPSLREVARSLINDQIDFEEMGRLSLGEYYADLSTDQRQEFTEVFAGIVRSQSLSDLSIYEAPVTVKSVSVNLNLATVNTSVEISGQDVGVTYKLYQDESKWWLYDVIIDGVGTVEGYSVSFQTFIRKRGFDSFMESLRKRLATAES